ncbi:SwmB domain-containing protein [Flavicella sediminum]|uniref:SwmB domain-containing protein n=1 Tax=Flavicella sediminum TaxID=2585141 RepID=UPI001124B71A|nr:SwmB domain-containing protein [Flavicella sediminum]
MKKLGILSYVFSLLFLVSCAEEYADYTPVDELTDVSWYISYDPYSQNPFDVATESFMSFMDLSQGAVSHEWIIEEGNHFLKEGYKRNDSLALFIDAEAGLSTNKAKAHVLLRNNGLNSIRLINKFKEPVAYNGKESQPKAKKVGDLWVLDTTFVFDVYGKLLPAFKVMQGDTELINITKEDLISAADSNTWPTVKVEAGASLTFIDLTTEDRPNSRSWSINNGAPANSNLESATIKFFQLGTNPAGTLKSIRSGELPAANASKLIPLHVEVVPSSQPFVLNGNLKEDENEVISFQVTGEVAPFSGEEGSFTVDVKDVGTIAVKNAKVSAENATRIELTLAQPIYNSDEIKVSYQGGNIKSSDTRDLAEFTDKLVSMHYENNILTSNSWSGYETAHGAANRGYLGPDGAFWVGANGTEADPNWSRALDKKFEGDASAKFSVDGVSKAFQLHHYGLGTIDLIPAGTYKVSIMVNVATGTTLDRFRLWGGEVTELGPLSWDLTDVARDEWVKIEHTVTLAAIDSKKKVSFNVNPGDNPNAITGRQTFYFDNFSLIPVEVRP